MVFLIDKARSTRTSVLPGDDVDEWCKVECLPLLSPDFQFQLNTYFNQGGKRFTSAMRCRYRSANII